MAKQKKPKTQAPVPLATAKIGTEFYSFTVPTTSQFTRYLEKIKNGQSQVAYRELLQVTCTTHSPEQVKELLAKKPVAIRSLKEAVEELSVGDAESEVRDDHSIKATLSGQEFSISGPDYEQWEKFQQAVDRPNSRLYEEMKKLILELCDEDADDLAALFAKAPAAANVFFDDITELAGAGIEVVVKKD